MIVGIDEVGRGCLAGPVCVAAVCLQVPIQGLGDSKVILPPVRRELALEIKKTAVRIGIGWASAEVIDTYGLTFALRVAALRAIAPFTDEVTSILLDGHHNYIQDPRVTTIIKGDASEPAISAASIIAKVARDSFMSQFAKLHPKYGFERHVGYGTAFHRAALQAEGPCALHRLSFGFVKELGNAHH